MSLNRLVAAINVLISHVQVELKDVKGKYTKKGGNKMKTIAKALKWYFEQTAAFYEQALRDGIHPFHV